MGGILIEEDLLVKESIIDSNTPEGKRIHEFLLGRAKALAGRYIDFDKHPITFLLSDTEEPNAFFAPAFDPKNKPRRHDYKTVRYIRNPIPTPVICITRGLLDIADNLDQLDFILGHELTHWMMRSFGIRHNSKGEEGIADLHSVDLMYDAGGDPKQAIVIHDKISAYAEARKDEESKYERSSRRDEEEEGVEWSTILDVHLTDSNRRAGIEASLTRLSHLIDDRRPTEFDKTPLRVEYKDPIEEFLAANHYKGRKPLGKLKLLVDCVAHLSAPMTPEDYFQRRFEALESELKDEDRYQIEFMRRDYNKQVEGGYPNYYKGPVMAKKYQQKIANLAEAIIDEMHQERRIKGKPNRIPYINAKDLLVYLQNVAYREISKHGYPKADDLNRKDAASLLYSYFYALFEENSLYWNQRRDREVQAKSVSSLHLDAVAEQKKIRQATTLDALKIAVERENTLRDIRIDIRTTGGESDRYSWKFDNLTGFRGGRRRGGRENISALFDKPKVGEIVPWQNLYTIAQTSEEAKAYVVDLLAKHSIEDFRITHNLPYVRIGMHSCYSLDNNGYASGDEVESYEIDYALHRNEVLAAYDYIRAYFEQEDALVERACRKARNISERDFKVGTNLRDEYNAKSKARDKVFALVSLFNSLPQDKDERRRDFESKRVLGMVQKSYRAANPVPGYNKNERFSFSEDLFYFDNPIFIEHFGEDFEDRQIARRNGYNQKVFDALLVVLDKHIDIWLESNPKKEALKEQVRDLRSSIWRLDRKEQKKERKVQQRKLEALRREYDLHNLRESESGRIISNFLGSIFLGYENSFRLKKLTDEQKTLLAKFAVRDEKGAVRKNFGASSYERFCDHLRILESKISRVVAGNYDLTDDMQVIAANYGYQQASTMDSLNEFVVNAGKDQGRRERRSYAWYLHAIDTIKYLEQSSRININGLMISLERIQRSADHREQEGLNDDAFFGCYKAYKDLITNGKVMTLVSQALQNAENFDAISFQELLQTADNVITYRNEMSKLLQIRDEYSYYDSQKEPKFTPEHKAFLNVLDERIEFLLKSAEALAHKEPQTLTKMKMFDALFNNQSSSYSGDSRSTFLEKWKAESFKKLTELSKDQSFWPDDVLEHLKAYVYANTIFLDNQDLENSLIRDILDKVEKLPPGRKKSECLYILLDMKMRPAYPETRDRIFDIYAQDVLDRIGKDDGTEKYQRRLSIYLKALDDNRGKPWDDRRNKYGQTHPMLSNSIAIADKYLLLKRVSDVIVSQERTSQMLKEACLITLNSDDMVKSYLYGAGVDYITETMDKDPELAKHYLQFLNSKGENADCDSISAYSIAFIKKENKRELSFINNVASKFDSDRHRIFYENFWSAPIDARAFIIARLLKSAVNTDDIQQNQSKNSWEHVFDVVMDTIIRPDDESVEAKYARDIMHSYIKSRSDYERVLILSAMMVSHRNIGADAGNIGKALKLFLENMGPAEIKLGQAIASHPDTPESIRKELQHLKSAANMPARWTVYDWIRAENIPEELWKGKYLGEIMGSASYYTSIALGEEEVLRILRPEAREKATKGFRVIGSTVEDLRAKEGTTDLSYRELTHSVQEMVTQAGRMSEIETDHDLGQQQYEAAKSLCDDVTITSGDKTFTLKVMDWRARGKNWIVMDRAKGVTYNSLPEKTPEEIAYKKQFAKGYILFEVSNILSGGRFDHDKHGDQLSVDTATDIAGLYDTGAMALRDPSPEEQKSLGSVIYKVLRAGMNGDDIVSAFGRVTSEQIEELHRAGQDTQYLVEVKKGILALGDFFKILNEEDIKEIFSSINFASDLSLCVQEGMTDSMSFFELAQWKAFLTIQSARESSAISIKRSERTVSCADGVSKFFVKPTIQDKSAWLQAVFNGDNNKSLGLGNTYSLYPQMLRPPVGMDAIVA